MLNIQNLTFSYSDSPVLGTLSLSIEDNHYFALAGINGAGKTTLIKLILDLLRSPNKQDILIDGISSWQVISRNDVIYLPEKFRLDANVSALEYFKLLSGVYKKVFNKERIIRLCEELDFPQAKLVEKSSLYSKGMLQKIGLIGCLFMDFKLLILDEPLSGLDPKARLQIKKLLTQEKANNRTILYSTHMLADVHELCDSFGILHNGSLQFIGTPLECLSRFNAETLEEAYMKCIDQ